MDEQLLRKLIEESNAIEGIYDPAEIDQSQVAWLTLEPHKELTHAAICRVQKIITLHQTGLLPTQRGYYRSMSQTNVIVGSHTPPRYQRVDDEMNHWLETYQSMTPWEAHCKFEWIHPFVDGNGRTGRMLMWWHELKNGQEPTMLLAAERGDYYHRLEEAGNV